MKVIHGGKKNDRLDGCKIAGLLRGDMFTQAYAYRAPMHTIEEAVLYLLCDKEPAQKWCQPIEARKRTAVMLSILAA